MYSSIGKQRFQMRGGALGFLTTVALVGACSAPAVDMGNQQSQQSKAPAGAGGAGGTGGTAASSTVASTGSASAGNATATNADGCLAPLLMTSPLNNYSLMSKLTLNVLPVAPNSTLRFDWSKLSLDLTRSPLAPEGEVAAVFLALLQLTPGEFETKLESNQRLNEFSKGALAYYPSKGETRATTDLFVAPGTSDPLPQAEIEPYFDPSSFDPQRHTYLVLVQDSADPARGVRMVRALQLDPESLTTDVAITNDSSTFSVSTDLASVVPVGIPAGEPDIVVDWSEMTVTALGSPWEDRAIDEVMVAHYSLTLQEITEQFLGLEHIADELYRGSVRAGNSLPLTTLTEDTTGQSFPGIDATGTWLLALNCGSCSNPAPWYLTVLQTCN